MIIGKLFVQSNPHIFGMENKMASKNEKRNLILNSRETANLVKFITENPMLDDSDELRLEWSNSSGIGVTVKAALFLKDGKDKVIFDITDYTCW
jgi:hypothetical protein